MSAVFAFRRALLGIALVIAPVSVAHAQDAGVIDVSSERDKALSAIGAARNALLQLDAGAGGTDARAKLDEAEALFAKAKYPEAAQAADAAWKLVSHVEREGTSFSVEVKPSGETRVTSKRGQPVRVEAQGVQRSVDPGHTVAVAKGSPPSEPEIAPPVPVVLAPKDDAVLKLKPNAKGHVGPVKLVWRKTAGAKAYAIEVIPVSGEAAPLKLQSAKAEVALPPLPPGKYTWKVRALGAAELSSAPSAPRSFELEAQKIKLEVRGTGWK